MDGRSAAAALGVGPLATKDEIRRAFRSRAKQTHPDIVGSDDAFIALRSAFELLLPLAPDEAPYRFVGSAGVRPQWRVEWLFPSSERPRPTLDRRDSCDGCRPAAYRPAPLRPAPHREAAAPARDVRGLTFEDHLAVALAGRR